ncbi:MAG TPA: hypothetical protein VM534_09720 [Thermoanaerobaculia bacterium]|nr:hypothetical protein [Thermoanaerobaculia bacterium]
MRPGKTIAVAIAFLALMITVVLLGPAGALGQERQPAAGDAVVSIGRDITVDAPVAGSLQVLAGSVRVDAPLGGNLIAFGADVTFGDGGRVEGDFFSLGGQVRGLRPGTVGGEVYAPGSVTAALEGVSRGKRPILTATENPFSLVTIALKLSLLLVWFILAVVITLLQGRELRFSSTEVRVSPFHTFFLGLVAFTSFLLTAIVFSYLIPYVIGLLLLAVLAVFAIVTKVYGMIAIFHAIGWMVIGPRSHEAARRRRWFRGDVAMVIAGLLILGAIRMIPVIGNILWMTASLVGVGVALSTGFGRREPRFLAWRPAAESVQVE